MLCSVLVSLSRSLPGCKVKVRQLTKPHEERRWAVDNVPELAWLQVISRFEIPQPRNSTCLPLTFAIYVYILPYVLYPILIYIYIFIRILWPPSFPILDVLSATHLPSFSYFIVILLFYSLLFSFISLRTRIYTLNIF